MRTKRPPFAEIVDSRKLEMFLLISRGASLKECMELTGFSYRHVRVLVVEWTKQGLVYSTSWAKYTVTARGNMYAEELKRVRDVLCEVGIWRFKE